MHRRIVLSKSLSPFVAVAIFPAAAATAAMTGPALLGSAANEPDKRFTARRFAAAHAPHGDLIDATRGSTDIAACQWLALTAKFAPGNYV